MKTISADGTVIISKRNYSVTVIDKDAVAEPIELPILRKGESDGPDHSAPTITTISQPSQHVSVRDQSSKSQSGVSQEADVNVFPYSSSVRLVAKFPHHKENEASACSGQFVSRDVILTAAHCVYHQPTQQWLTTLYAQQGYRLGSYKQAHDWECIAFYSGWTYNNHKRDYALVKMRTSSDDYLAINGGIPRTVLSVGYPGNYSGGHILQRVQGDVIGRGGIIGHRPNPFGKGSSGGAWQLDGFAFTVNSFKWDDDPTTMWGPRFDGDTTNLFRYVHRGCTVPEESMSTTLAAFELSDNEAMVFPDAQRNAPGPDLVRAPHQTCKCGADGQYLRNTTQFPYSVRLAAHPSMGSVGAKAIQRSQLDLKPGTHEFIGCSAPSKPTTGCDAGVVPIIESMAKRITTINLAKAAQEISITPQFCSEHCLNHPNKGYCKVLGDTLAPMIAPLAGFIYTDLARPPKDGVVATVNDMIIRFGGQPQSSQNECHRGDFVAKNGSIVNRGLSCTAITRQSTDDDQVRLALNSPDEIVGTPHFSKKLTTFDQFTSSPALLFAGKGSADNNSLFGGQVQAAESVQNKLIVTTMNGCVMATEQ